MEYKTHAQTYLVGKAEEQITLEDEWMGEKVMVKCILRKRMEQGVTDSSGFYVHGSVDHESEFYSGRS
jgi:hypothetical protein